MATSQYGLNAPETVKLWSRKLFREALKQTWAYKFMGPTSDSMIQVLDDTQKGPGDRITVLLRMQLTGTGVLGDNVLEGSEEALTTYTQNFVINQIRHAVRSDGKMTEQRIPFEIREEARMGLTDWFADRFDTSLFNQLCGNTGQADTRFTGCNATVAPSSDKIIYADTRTSEADVESASASTTMKLNYIDRAVTLAKTASPLIRPVKVNGEDKYLLFIHPYQTKSLRINTATGQWLDIQKAALQGGIGDKSPIYTGAIGEYNNVIIHESVRIPSVTANVYRAVLCGAQSAVAAFGQDSDMNKASWNEKLFDYGNQLGVSAGVIWGAKKTIFNSSDFGTVVIATHADNTSVG